VDNTAAAQGDAATSSESVTSFEAPPLPAPLAVARVDPLVDNDVERIDSNLLYPMIQPLQWELRVEQVKKVKGAKVRAFATSARRVIATVEEGDHPYLEPSAALSEDLRRRLPADVLRMLEATAVAATLDLPTPESLHSTKYEVDDLVRLTQATGYYEAVDGPASVFAALRKTSVTMIGTSGGGTISFGMPSTDLHVPLEVTAPVLQALRNARALADFSMVSPEAVRDYYDRFFCGQAILKPLPTLVEKATSAPTVWKIQALKRRTLSTTGLFDLLRGPLDRLFSGFVKMTMGASYIPLQASRTSPPDIAKRPEVADTLKTMLRSCSADEGARFGSAYITWMACRGVKLRFKPDESATPESSAWFAVCTLLMVESLDDFHDGGIAIVEAILSGLKVHVSTAQLDRLIGGATGEEVAKMSGADSRDTAAPLVRVAGLLAAIRARKWKEARFYNNHDGFGNRPLLRVPDSSDFGRRDSAMSDFYALHESGWRDATAAFEAWFSKSKIAAAVLGNYIFRGIARQPSEQPMENFFARFGLMMIHIIERVRSLGHLPLWTSIATPARLIVHWGATGAPSLLRYRFAEAEMEPDQRSMGALLKQVIKTYDEYVSGTQSGVSAYMLLWGIMQRINSWHPMLFSANHQLLADCSLFMYNRMLKSAAPNAALVAFLAERVAEAGAHVLDPEFHSWSRMHATRVVPHPEQRMGVTPLRDVLSHPLVATTRAPYGYRNFDLTPEALIDLYVLGGLPHVHTFSEGIVITKRHLAVTSGDLAGGTTAAVMVPMPATLELDFTSLGVVGVSVPTALQLAFPTHEGILVRGLRVKTGIANASGSMAPVDAFTKAAAPSSQMVSEISESATYNIVLASHVTQRLLSAFGGLSPSSVGGAICHVGYAQGEELGEIDTSLSADADEFDALYRDSGFFGAIRRFFVVSPKVEYLTDVPRRSV